MLRKNRTKSRPTTSVEINLDGQIIPYTLVISQSTHHVRLQISAADGLRVILPQQYPLSRAEEFIRAKQRWIKKKLSMMQHNQEIYADDTHIQYLGVTLSIRRLKSVDSSATIRLADTELEISLPENVTEIRPIVDAWMRTRARDVIGALVNQHSRHMQVSYSKLNIRNAKTRWGSCSARSSLSFNWKLIMVPLETIEYVVIHELCHLREMNHSPSFWKLVEQYSPNWRSHRHWLRCNDGALCY